MKLQHIPQVGRVSMKIPQVITDQSVPSTQLNNYSATTNITHGTVKQGENSELATALVREKIDSNAEN